MYTKNQGQEYCVRIVTRVKYRGEQYPMCRGEVEVSWESVSCIVEDRCGRVDQGKLGLEEKMMNEHCEEIRRFYTCNLETICLGRKS